jgi:hypothetical protein
MILWRSQRTTRFVRERTREASRRPSLWIEIVAALAVCVAVGGCGVAAAHNGFDATQPTSAAERAPEYVSPPPGPILTRIHLPAGPVTGIMAIRCSVKPSCYQFATYWEQPSRYGGGKHHKKFRVVVGSTGPAISDATPGERTVLYIGVLHQCAGTYPYALAFGLLRDPRDLVTDRADGRTVSLKKVVIPARLHPEGVLAYRLLLPGQNEIVVRTPDGHIVERRDWQGSNEEASCGGRRK